MVSLDDLRRPDYPLASAYDPQWLVDRNMGPHPLWLLENLAADLDLQPGMRVLDLASGQAATSVFLAKEYGVEVWAADLWVPASAAQATAVEAGVGERVHAFSAEAHALPFELESFDAVVCIDAYEYFGTADGYLAYITGFLRPGGVLGIAGVALRREVRDLGHIPGHIKRLVGWEAMAWHTADWWRFQWDVTELVDVVSARHLESGWADWTLWERVCAEHGDPQARTSAASTVAMLEEDGGEYVTFALVTARKR